MRQIRMADRKHKTHARERKTVCGIEYDNTTMHKFIPRNLVGHWRKVTCRRCLKHRENYEEELKCDALRGKNT